MIGRKPDGEVSMAIIFGSGGNNVLSSRNRGDIILGLDGDDTLTALHGFNILLGGDGDDRLTALSSFNILSGGAGRDTLHAALGWNLLTGGDGDDTLSSSADSNLLDGGAGNDTLTVLAGSGNILSGGDGDDVFILLGGSDTTVMGGLGRDTVSYAGTTQAVTVNLGAGTGSGTGTITGIENVTGGEGEDTITGDDGDNILQGGGGNDTLEGGAGNDIVDGGAGDDLIIGGSGAGDDTYLGGDGNDTVSYASTTLGVTVNLAAETATGPEIGSDTLNGIENVIGGTGNDTLIGDANANLLDGGEGDDTIRGGAGEDILMGGAGIDTLSYEDSPSRVIVNMFVTSPITIGVITVDPGHAFDGFTFPPIPFPSPVDTISGFETVIGSAFNDHIQGTTNVANVLMGGAGNDTLAGSGASDGIGLPAPGAANDVLLGGAGNDVLRQSRGNDIIDGGEGTFDQLEFTNNGIVYGGAIGVSVNLAMGTSDADPNNGDAVNGPGGDVAAISGIESVVGTAGNDVFVGGDLQHAPGVETGQTEFFQPLGGTDTITGKAGPGWSAAVDYGSNNSLQPVSVVLGNSNNIGAASDGFGFIDTLTEVDVVRGGAGNDLLVGGSYGQGASGVFVEAFRGNAGNDTIDGGGSDTVIGAYGVTDRAEYNSSPRGVVVNTGVNPISGNFYGGGVITVFGGTARDGFDITGGGTDTLIDINVVRGSNFNDTLIGGNPKFDNNERFEGLAGNDFIDGGSGNDEADYSSSPTAVLVNLGTGTASDGFGGTDTLVSVERARGSDFNDTLIGGANALERLTGGRGNDFIDGGSMTGVNYASFVLGTSGASASIANGVGTASNDGQGGTDTLMNINGLWGSNFADVLSGGTGDQWFIGEGGSDLINGGADTDTVSYMADPNAVTVNLAMNTATDGWGGIWGLLGTDTLISIENVEGSSFNDTLIGDANANVIDGGGGIDTLTGGGSIDVFRFGSSAANNTVTDFDDDVLDFSPLFAAAGIEAPAGEDPLEWLVIQGYLIADSTADIGGGAANDTVVQVDLDGSSGPGADYTVVTLTDVTLGTTGSDADNWLV
jgi:Ca2+-binding RTX toxin-like protein